MCGRTTTCRQDARRASRCADVQGNAAGGSSAAERGDQRLMQALKERIRHVPDFPKPGILFYDVTTLLKDGEGFQLAVEAMTAPNVGARVDLVVGIESRGFTFGAAVADRLKAGFSPVRKPGKLPSTKQRATYDLEY